MHAEIFHLTKISIYDLHLELIWDAGISNPSMIADVVSSFLLLTEEIFTPLIFTSWLGSNKVQINTYMLFFLIFQ